MSLPDQSDAASVTSLWREAGILVLFVAEATLVAGGIVLAAFYLT